MSQNPSEHPPGNPAEQSSPSHGPTNEELAAQAKAAADQALQMAKLAEESARLARQLNEQVAARGGYPIPPPPPPTSPDVSHEETPSATDEPDPAIIPASDEPWREAASRGSRRSKQRRQTARREQFERQSMRGQTPDVPRRVRIKTNAQDRWRDGNTGKGFVRNWKSVLLSTGLHVVVLAILGLLTIAIRKDDPINTIMASFAEEEATVEEAVPVEEPIEEEGEQQEEPMPEEPPPKEEEKPKEPPPEPMPEEKMEVAEEPPPPTPGPEPAAPEPAVDLAKVGSRSETGKAMLLEKYGGTAASESAVSRALDWFVSVQRPDGSWNFNDVGQSSHAGDANNPMGATSYVLLSFLGAGQTHRSGKYKSNVTRGLTFLLNNGRSVGAGADFRGPNVKEHNNFYVQGAAAMVLCEAYSMTKDRKLLKPAQGAVRFILAAQDPHGGGWRYEPYEPGCTSVTTLQLTALISANRAGFKVSPQALEGVRHFYTTVKADEGPTGRYCYRAAEPTYKAASTAQASLGRMYLGASKDDEDLQAAVEILDQRGPYSNRYYCYYATQVMKNWGGPAWERWNQSMREELVRTQVSSEGPAFGSWTPLQRGGTDVGGGRLFITALSTMTLEVYYRYLPLYDAFEQDPATGTTKVTVEKPGIKKLPKPVEAALPLAD